MKRLKLALYIGLPLFWMMMYLLAVHSGYRELFFVYFFDVGPVFIILFLAELYTIYRIESFGFVLGTLIGLFVFVGGHAACWLPVAHCINKLWERHERKSKRDHKV
ncbi:MAG: hypothetical protein EB829_04785 [Nitrosopumilus sp. H8]|nr:MAG: hypothetical protein EB829_04785 [Nitrosopumilus sp. H8]